MSTATKQIEELANTEYKYGFITDTEQDIVPVGLNEDVVRLISSKKGEPEWLLEWRLKAFRAWLKMVEPHWQNVTYAPIDYQGTSYYAAPKEKKKLNSLDEVDPEIRATFDKLGIPLEEQKLLSNVAVDAVFDSVSVATTFRSKLAELGIIFCSFSEAVKDHPELVKQYVGSVVPHTDNYFAALNSAVFSDGNFVSKRGICKGDRSKITWTQVETGSAVTWKYPSCILQGNDSIGEFYSVAVTNNFQQADTGTKMIHLGKNTRSTIVSKGISAGRGQNTYRGAGKIGKRASNARNYSQCDSLLIGDRCGAHTFPYLEIKNTSASVEHEASTSKIGEDQIFYCEQRGILKEDAINMIVSGFCKEVFRELPMEFAVEAQKLLGISLEGSVG